MQPAAYILTGGQSDRFGNTDKALALLNGRTLVERAAAQIEIHCSSVTLVAAAGHPYASLPFEVIEDRYPDKGPLGGIDAALAHVGPNDWAFICPCDVGYVGKSWLPTLVAASHHHDDIILFEGTRVEPLFSLYHGRISPQVEAAILANELAPHRLIRKLKTCALPLPSNWPEEPSINTPEFLEAFKKRT